MTKDNKQLSASDRSTDLPSDPAWLDAPIPEHKHFEYVGLCLDWHRTKNSRQAVLELPLQNRGGIEQRDLLFVAIAMRDADLLQYLNHDIRSAWIAIFWPEAINSVRREVVWTLSEWARKEENGAKGVEDLFDLYDPVPAERRARGATRAARQFAIEGDEEAARTAQVRANLFRAIADARLARDVAEKDEARAWLLASAS
jgi:hypothetical protein